MRYSYNTIKTLGQPLR